MDTVRVVTKQSPTKAVTSVACLWMLSLSSTTFAQGSAASSPAVDNGIPIEQLLEGVLKRAGKTFIVDPRARARHAGWTEAGRSRLRSIVLWSLEED